MILPYNFFGIPVTVSNFLPFTNSTGEVQHYIITYDNSIIIVVSQWYYDNKILKEYKPID